MKNLAGSDEATIAERLWSSDLFWKSTWDGSPWPPGIHSMEPSCLQLLQESLKLYNAAAEKPPDGLSLDTTRSNWLLVAVDKELANQEHLGTRHAADVSRINADAGSTVAGHSVPEPAPLDGDTFHRAITVDAGALPLSTE